VEIGGRAGYDFETNNINQKSLIIEESYGSSE